MCVCVCVCVCVRAYVRACVRVCACDSVVSYPIGRLKIYGENRIFHLGDNPLVPALADKLKAGNIKIFFEFLKTEEYNL